MRKRVQIAFAVFAVALLGVIAWQVLRQREPVYQGKVLSSWLEDLDLESAHSPEKATQAVRAIGTNGFPVLIKMLCTEDPLWKRGLIAFNARQSFIQLRISQADVVRYRAVQGYGALGAAAKDSVPALIQIMDLETSAEVRSEVAAALSAIGPQARAAIPVLMKAAADKNPALRRNAISALANIQRWDQGTRF
jgi:Tfp pilus assembly protein PilV